MAAKLNYTISQSNFESIRDVIAAILKVEMDNQAVRRGSGNPVVPNANYTANFYTERYTPPGISEGNVISVNVEGGPFSGQTPKSQVYECVFNIDIFTSASETSTGEGYYNSSVKLHRLAGLVRHILQSPYYDRLGLSNGIVQKRSVGSIRFGNVNDEQDGAFVRMSRVQLTVDIYEESSEISPFIMAGYDTIIKIAQTEKGYLLTYNNE